MKGIATIAGLAFVLALLTASLLFVHRVETGQDNLEYLLQARSLQHGLVADAMGWHRPPGYAALAAAALGAGGVVLPLGVFTVSAKGLYLVAALNVLLFALSAPVILLWARTLTRSAGVAIGVALLFAVNQTVAAMSTVIAAEPMLLLTLFLALLAWEGGVEVSGSRAMYAGFALCILLAASAKYQGLCLAAAAVAWVLWKRRGDRKAVACAATAVVVAVAAVALQFIRNPHWLTRLVSAQPYATGETVTFFGRLARWLACYPAAWADLLVPKVMDEYGALARLGLAALAQPLTWAVSALMLTGFVVSVRRGIRLSHVFIVGYAALLVVWPDYLQRYLLPVAPFGFLFLLEGLWAIAGWVRLSPKVCAAFVALLLGWGVATDVFAGVKNWRNIIALRHVPPWAPERYLISREDDFADYMTAGQWLGSNTPPDAVIFCRKALFIELASGRCSEYYSAAATPEILWQSMEATARTTPVYILRDSFSAAGSYGQVRELKLMPAIRRHSDRLEVLHRTAGGSEILRVLPPR